MLAGIARSVAVALLVAGCLLQAAENPVPRQQGGGWRLADESSPYLRMHAANPVAWYPWGEQAFARAREEHKPLFISIGYFTCHWCHVMARESFADPGIARLLNEHFIAVKVDREQRPDVDAIYLRYVTRSAGHGGWPLSVWATPEGRPFFGGTYYPPGSVPGQTGLRELLQRLAGLWRTDRERIRQVAENAVASLRAAGESAAPLAALDERPLREARARYAAEYDELQGGFGQAPKFPQPARLLFLLQDKAADSSAMALQTLEAMAAGGIHDQLEGGFHRYAVDPGWQVPHFEKMLYDQALIARAYLWAFRLTGERHYADTARTTLDFSLAALRHPQGGFYSALAADSRVPGEPAGEPREGAYYTWSRAQLDAALPQANLRDWAVARYGITRAGEAHGEVAGSNVLYRALDVDGLAARFGVEPGAARTRLAQLEERLRAARRTRPAPPVDDKVIAAWNGYMITTLALAAELLAEPRYLEAAVAAADFIETRLLEPQGQRLFRDWREGVRGAPAFCEDYAALAEAWLALYRASGEGAWLVKARRLADAMLARFRDERRGGFFNAGADTELWLREKPLVDAAAVSANGVALQVLLQLAVSTGASRYRELALETAAWAGSQLADSPAAMPYTLLAWPVLLALQESSG